jgi:hypothetical protein
MVKRSARPFKIVKVERAPHPEWMGLLNERFAQGRGFVVDANWDLNGDTSFDETIALSTRSSAAALGCAVAPLFIFAFPVEQNQPRRRPMHAIY